MQPRRAHRCLVSATSLETARVEKVRKLIALSGSANAHEAALAAQKAQELMRRHGFDMAQISPGANGIAGAGAVDAARTEGRLDPWRRKLAASIAESMGGTVVFARSRRGADAGVMSFFGPAGTAQRIAALYRHLEVQLTAIAAIATADRAHTRVDCRTYRTSFLLGAVDRLHWRLSRHRAEVITASGSRDCVSSRDCVGSQDFVIARSALDGATEEPLADTRAALDGATEEPLADTRSALEGATEEPLAELDTERQANALSLHWNAYRRGERAGATVDLAA